MKNLGLLQKNKIKYNIEFNNSEKITKIIKTEYSEDYYLFKTTSNTYRFINNSKLVSFKESLFYFNGYLFLENGTVVMDSSDQKVFDLNEKMIYVSVSNDEEIILVVSESNQLFILTQDFEMINKVKVFENRTKNHMISWRENGNNFVLLFESEDGKNYFSIFKRNGELIKHSGENKNLLNAVSWKPDGSLISIAEKVNKKEFKIGLYERNGLRHNEIILRNNNIKSIESLHWNIDSTVLAIQLRINKKDYVIQFWMISNYYWYLKYELRRKNKSWIFWDNEESLRIHLFSDSYYYSYEFNLGFSVSKKNNLMGIIDGSKLFLTPLELSMIPPPLAVREFEFEKGNNINNVFFMSESNCERGVIQYSNDSYKVFDLNVVNKAPKFGLDTIKLIRSGESENRIIFNVDKTIVSVEVDENNKDIIVINNDSTNYYSEKPFRGKFYNSYIKDNEILYIQNDIGEVYKMDRSFKIERMKKFLPQKCNKFMVVLDREIVGLNDSRGILYLSNDLLSSECSSFVVNDKFLFFTTFSNQLIVIPIRKLLDYINHSNHSNNTVRNLERGSELIWASNAIKVVLKLPRGNLEGIYPKILSFNYVKRLLTEKNYGLAFLTCRKYKVDINLIFDFDPTSFDVEKFINDVDKSSYLNIFLSQLRNENVLEKIYKDFDVSKECNFDSELFKNKVNSICERFRSVLTRKVEKKYITTLLTSFAKSNPPQLEKALLFIKKNSKGNINEIEDQIRYLVFLVDVNEIYDTSLGLYDFDLTLIVAKISQRDPKEYIPFLSHIRKQKKYYQRFLIDVHLKKYKKALDNISKSLEIQKYYAEILDVIEQNILFNYALTIFGGELKKRVYFQFGVYLEESEDDNENAGFCFLQCQEYEKAQECFVVSGDFHYAFALSKRLKQDKTTIMKLGRQILNVLQDKRKFKEASVVLREYLNEDEESILLLSEQRLWNEAIRVAILKNRNDLIQTDIIPEINSEYEEFYEEVEQNFEKLSKYVERLIEIREEKIKFEEKQNMLINDSFVDEDIMNSGNIKNVDTFSEADSVRTGLSTYSGVTVYSTIGGRAGFQKNVSRKSHKRKKLKKGSPFEEDNLVNRIYSLLPNKVQQDEVNELLKCLIYINEFGKAKKLQILFQKILDITFQNRSVIEMSYLPPIIQGEKIKKEKHPKKIEDVIGKILNWRLKVLE